MNSTVSLITGLMTLMISLISPAVISNPNESRSFLGTGIIPILDANLSH